MNVIVIGAGMAGLAAARTLKDAGVDVMILEGRERSGGRVWTDRSLGVPMDLGASWIHGTARNPLVQLAKQLGMETRTTNYDDVAVFDADGSRVSAADLAKAGTEWAEILAGVEKYATDLDADVSVASAFRNVLHGEKLSAREQRTLEYMQTSLVVTAAEELGRLSLWYADSDEAFEGEDVLFPGGYGQLVAGLEKGLDIKHEHTVSMVEHSPEGVRVHTNHGVFEADGTIVTLPLGVLQSRNVRFSPELPDAKQKAIHHLNMGVLNKVALRFPRSFWDKGHEFMGYMSNRQGEYPLFMNWSHHTNQPVLMAFTAGDFARELEHKSDEKITAEVMAVLRRIYGKKALDPEAVRVSRWRSDPMARGAYSHVPLGGSDAAYDVMARPLPGQTVLFAGEATNRRHRGTVHGAFMSGLREADRVIGMIARAE